MSQFKYDFFTKIKFKNELKRQEKYLDKRYIAEIDKNKHSYWVEVKSMPLPDLNMEDYLSEFSKPFINAKNINFNEDFSERAPEDIYPVY